MVLLVILLGSVLTVGLAQDANAQACVVTYDESVDYFPDKAELGYAEGFEVRYFNNYKVVNVTNPWIGATVNDQFQYVLVQCGTPAPDPADFLPTAQFIEVPAGTLISMSTTQLPHLTALDLVDNLIGLDSLQYTNTEAVVEKIEAEALLEVGSGPTMNVEAVLDAEPSMVMTFGSGFPDFDSHPVLLDAGVFVAMNAEFTETSVLGRAEWVKFTATFYNKEAEASAVFDAVVDDYNAIVDMTQAIPDDERVTVLWNSFSPFTEAWSIPGQATWVGGLLADAGVDYVLQEDAPENDSYLTDFEVVYDAGIDADFWVINAFGINTLDDLIGMDERNGDFAAVANGTVYNNNGRENAFGGNDYYENGVLNPNVVLRDLVGMFYPDLLPDHEITYYKVMEE